MKRLFTRLLTVSLLMVFGLTSAWAQKSVLNESFTGKALPAGWSTSGDFWEFQEGSVKFNAFIIVDDDFQYFVDEVDKIFQWTGSFGIIAVEGIEVAEHRIVLVGIYSP